MKALEVGVENRSFLNTLGRLASVGVDTRCGAGEVAERDPGLAASLEVLASMRTDGRPPADGQIDTSTTRPYRPSVVDRETSPGLDQELRHPDAAAGSPAWLLLRHTGAALLE